MNALPGKPSQNWVLEPIINLGAACYTAQPNKQALDLVRQVMYEHRLSVKLRRLRHLCSTK